MFPSSVHVAGLEGIASRFLWLQHPYRCRCFSNNLIGYDVKNLNAQSKVASLLKGSAEFAGSAVSVREAGFGGAEGVPGQFPPIIQLRGKIFQIVQIVTLETEFYKDVVVRIGAVGGYSEFPPFSHGKLWNLQFQRGIAGGGRFRCKHSSGEHAENQNNGQERGNQLCFHVLILLSLLEERRSFDLPDFGCQQYAPCTKAAFLFLLPPFSKY